MSEVQQYEKSCGAVVFRAAEGVVQYLLVRGHEGFWGFPKGHVEAGESEQATALREIREETGLDVALVDGFRTTNAHTLAREGKLNTIKQNVYFLAQCPRQTPSRRKARSPGSPLWTMPRRWLSFSSKAIAGS